jgi:hypothetical protein
VVNHCAVTTDCRRRRRRRRRRCHRTRHRSSRATTATRTTNPRCRLIATGPGPSPGTRRHPSVDTITSAPTAAGITGPAGDTRPRAPASIITIGSQSPAAPRPSATPSSRPRSPTATPILPSSRCACPRQIPQLPPSSSRRPTALKDPRVATRSARTHDSKSRPGRCLPTGAQQGRGDAGQEGEVARNKARDRRREPDVLLLVVELVVLVGAGRAAARVDEARGAGDADVGCGGRGREPRPRRPQPRHGLQPDNAVLRQPEGVERLGLGRGQPRPQQPTLLFQQLAAARAPALGLVGYLGLLGYYTTSALSPPPRDRDRDRDRDLLYIKVPPGLVHTGDYPPPPPPPHPPPRALLTPCNLLDLAIFYFQSQPPLDRELRIVLEPLDIHPVRRFVQDLPSYFRMLFPPFLSIHPSWPPLTSMSLDFPHTLPRPSND